MKNASLLWKKSIVSLCVVTAALITAPVVMAADGANNTAVTTNSGLRYIDMTVGKGDVATAGQTVAVHYTGWLQNPDGTQGKKFDSSRDRGQPFVFGLGQHQVIAGWDEGVQGMKVGGERRLIIPSALGYGVRGAGGGLIPPNANLIFDVELIKVR